MYLPVFRLRLVNQSYRFLFLPDGSYDHLCSRHLQSATLRSRYNSYRLLIFVAAELSR